MQTHQFISLSQQYKLSIEREAGIVRLVVVKDNLELVCRKEKVAVLNKFLQQTTAHLFTGRLQLYKNNGTVAVVVKGEIIGITRVEALTDLLKKL